MKRYRKVGYSLDYCVSSLRWKESFHLLIQIDLPNVTSGRGHVTISELLKPSFNLSSLFHLYAHY